MESDEAKSLVPSGSGSAVMSEWEVAIAWAMATSSSPRYFPSRCQTSRGPSPGSAGSRASSISSRSRNTVLDGTSFSSTSITRNDWQTGPASAAPGADGTALLSCRLWRACPDSSSSGLKLHDRRQQAGEALVQLVPAHTVEVFHPLLGSTDQPRVSQNPEVM